MCLLLTNTSRYTQKIKLKTKQRQKAESLRQRLDLKRAPSAPFLATKKYFSLVNLESSAGWCHSWPIRAEVCDNTNFWRCHLSSSKERRLEWRESFSQKSRLINPWTAPTEFYQLATFIFDQDLLRYLLKFSNFPPLFLKILSSLPWYPAISSPRSSQLKMGRQPRRASGVKALQAIKETSQTNRTKATAKVSHDSIK